VRGLHLFRRLRVRNAGMLVIAGRCPRARRGPA
jgi:hypothetical protein